MKYNWYKATANPPAAAHAALVHCTARSAAAKTKQKQTDKQTKTKQNKKNKQTKRLCRLLLISYSFY